MKLTQKCVCFTNPCINLLVPPSITRENHPKAIEFSLVLAIWRALLVSPSYSRDCALTFGAYTFIKHRERSNKIDLNMHTIPVGNGGSKGGLGGHGPHIFGWPPAWRLAPSFVLNFTFRFF